MPELFIDGQWRDASDQERREVRCPADGSLVATVSEATPDDAADAVRAARRAFDHGPWPATPVTERSALLHRLADHLEASSDTVARLEALDTGKRLVEAEMDVADVVSVFRYYAALARSDLGRVVDPGQPGVTSRIVHEPVGVCTLITPWNFPLLQTSWRSRPRSRRATASCSSRVS